ncbi:MAG TPA: hypothetical protein VKC57_01645, partial [Ktedonobacterales bacterium]|nr:hypothetical protein [Ktedonobacterales bacterium]
MGERSRQAQLGVGPHDQPGPAIRLFRVAHARAGPVDAPLFLRVGDLEGGKLPLGEAQVAGPILELGLEAAHHHRRELLPVGFDG